MSYRVGLAVVGTFQSTADAETARGILAAVGVDSLLRSDNATSQTVSQTEVLVRTDDSEKAKHVLAHATSASG
jgi:hypothetical protein